MRTPSTKLTFRKRWYSIIAHLIDANRGLELKQLRKILRANYPGNPYSHTTGIYPLRVWRDECRIQLGLKPRRRDLAFPQPPSCPGQKHLFGESTK